MHHYSHLLSQHTLASTLIAILMACSFSANAAVKRDIIVTFESGDSTILTISHGLEMRVAGSDLLLAGDNTNETYKLDSVRTFRYRSTETVGVGAPASGLPVYTFTDAGVQISLPGADDNICRIYNAAGEEVDAIRFNSDLGLDLSNHPKGIYIIQVNNLPAIKTIIR